MQPRGRACAHMVRMWWCACGGCRYAPRRRRAQSWGRGCAKWLPPRQAFLHQKPENRKFRGGKALYEDTKFRGEVGTKSETGGRGLGCAAGGRGAIFTITLSDLPSCFGRIRTMQVPLTRRNTKCSLSAENIADAAHQPGGARLCCAGWQRRGCCVVGARAKRGEAALRVQRAVVQLV